MNTKYSRIGMSLALFTAATLALSACSTSAGDTDVVDGAGPGSGSAAASAQPRVSLTYDGGVYVLNGETLEVEADLPLEGFNRLNPAGDGRHVLVTTDAGFQVLDTGSWTDAAGDSHQQEPALTDLVFEADAAGHVVRHAGKTILFADGTGETTIFDTDALLESETTLPEVEVVEAEAAHHGVSIVLEDNTLLSTLGNADGRTGIRVLDANRNEVTRNEDCPSVHGEGAAANELSVFGCSNGVLVYDNGEITKITAPDAYGRAGNIFTTETSTIAVGDYNSNPDSEGYLLTELTFVDTVAKTAEIVDMPAGASFTFRDIARGPNDEALVLSSDGSLYVFDAETREITDTIPVIESWDGPVEWQDAHPALIVVGDTAYITEPSSNSVHALDLATGEVVATTELDSAPNEIAVVTG
ncbi:MAG: hypothetical protein JWQ43_2870 [Glaciihabitans sp.]|nr:hypothetical protein [Glaciihabitans sp.]